MLLALKIIPFLLVYGYFSGKAERDRQADEEVFSICLPAPLMPTGGITEPAKAERPGLSSRPLKWRAGNQELKASSRASQGTGSWLRSKVAVTQTPAL